MISFYETTYTAVDPVNISLYSLDSVTVFKMTIQDSWFLTVDGSYFRQLANIFDKVGDTTFTFA